MVGARLGWWLVEIDSFGSVVVVQLGLGFLPVVLRILGGGCLIPNEAGVDDVIADVRLQARNDVVAAVARGSGGAVGVFDVHVVFAFDGQTMRHSLRVCNGKAKLKLTARNALKPNDYQRDSGHLRRCNHG